MTLNACTDHSIKKYYAIGEVAKLLNVSTSLIRFWEKTFPSLRPQKNKQGARRYTQSDIQQLTYIHQLVKKQGYTLQGAKEAIKYQRDLSSNHTKLIHTLNNLRTFLVHLKENILDT